MFRQAFAHRTHKVRLGNVPSMVSGEIVTLAAMAQKQTNKQDKTGHSDLWPSHPKALSGLVPRLG